MGLLDTLKWLWDPRTPEQKAYDAWDKATPLQTHTQYFTVWITGIVEPFEISTKVYDFSVGSFGNMRIDLDYYTQRRLDKWGTNGITIRGVFYPTARIEKIEIGRVDVTNKVDHA